MPSRSVRAVPSSWHTCSASHCASDQHGKASLTAQPDRTFATTGTKIVRKAMSLPPSHQSATYHELVSRAEFAADRFIACLEVDEAGSDRINIARQEMCAAIVQLQMAGCPNIAARMADDVARRIPHAIGAYWDRLPWWGKIHRCLQCLLGFRS